MGKIKDITNERFGSLTAIKNTGRKDSHRNYIWLCQCDCGNFCEVIGNNLRTGHTKSCGCLRAIQCSNIGKKQHIIDETGKQYFRLTVVSFAYISKSVAYWNCRCECGNNITVAGNHLRSGHTKSCGCMKSMGEFLINQILSENNIKYTTQYTVQSPYNGHYRYDFAIWDENNNLLRLIEFDGEQHYQDKCTPYYGYFDILHQRDIEKNQYCKDNNIPLIRIPYYKKDSLDLNCLLGNEYLIE